MREIEFRAKTSSEVNGFNHKKDGIWVYGFYRDKVGLPVISEFDTTVCDYIDYEVDRNTLGQYTGLKDKNDTKVFEGDILELYDKISKIHWLAIIEFGNPNGVYDWGYQLKWLKTLEPTGVKECSWNTDILVWVEVPDVECKVIGNIYDNPELLKGEE